MVVFTPKNTISQESSVAKEYTMQDATAAKRQPELKDDISGSSHAELENPNGLSLRSID